MSTRADEADAIIVGAGLAGLVAAAELVEAGKKVIVLEQEPEASLGGQAFWSFGGLFLVDTPEQRRMGIRDSRELAWSDWLGSAGFDREEDLWPRRWAEAYVDFAAGEKRSWLHARGVRFFPVVGWAERGGIPGHGPRQLRPALPRHLGDGAGRAGAVHRRRQGRGAARARLPALPPPGDGAHRDERHGGRCARRDPGAELRRARRNQLARRVRRLRAAGGRGDRDVRRDRGEPRAGSRQLAAAHGSAAEADALRRPRARGRADDRGRPRHRRRHHQPRPDVALHGGDQELGADLADARHPHPPRPVVALVRRAGAPPASAALPRLRHARHPRAHHAHRVRLHLVRAHAEDHREGVRALRQRAEPRPHGEERAQGALARAPRRAAPGGGVQGEGRGLHRPEDAAGAGGGDERARRRAADRRGLAGGRDPRARPAAHQPVRKGPANHRAPRRARLPRRPADPRREAAPHPRSRRRAADRRPSQHPHPQDAGRRAHRPLRPRAARRRRAAPRPLRRRRGGRLRRRRDARLPLAGRHLSGRMHLLRARGGQGRGRGLSNSNLTQRRGDAEKGTAAPCVSAALREISFLFLHSIPIGCFGNQSEAGLRYAERILSVSATCQQQQVHPLDFVALSIAALRAGKPAPKLLANST